MNSQPDPAAAAGRISGRLQTREQVPAAAAAGDQRRRPAPAERHALRGADGQHRGLRHRRPGGPRRGLPDLAELRRRLGHEEGRHALRHRADDVQGPGQGSRGPARRRQGTTVECRGRVHPPGDAAAPERHGAEHLRPGQGQARFSQGQRRERRRQPHHRPDQPGLHDGAGAVRRHRVQASDLGRRAGRQRQGDQARHHRPARPDLRRIQRERAGCPEDPPEPRQPAPHGRGAGQDPPRYRPDERGGLSRTPAS